MFARPPAAHWRASVRFVPDVAIETADRRLVLMSVSDTTAPPSGGLLASILSEDTFRPAEPRTIDETGLTSTVIENMLLKYVLLIGSASGRQISDNLCLPFVILEPIYQSLRQRQLLVNSSSAQFGDFN